MSMRTELEILRRVAERIADLAVLCRDCSTCCRSGLVYVLDEEVALLKERGVPLLTIDGIHYIQRTATGSCPMLDTKTDKCGIYDERPMCCRLYPVDLFSRSGTAEWGLYEYCPIDRYREGGLACGGSGRLDRGALLQALQMSEARLGQRFLKYLVREDEVSAAHELLDNHRLDFSILGRAELLECRSTGVSNG